ncbi:MAG TPA: gamma carbonic anhydrase family protein [Spirochaetota bacterium]|nr:gamma carbonic anhydrase family protein [Spirochaetota bacterium]HRZ27915.1 gamma carbonic anhydrase family protein [Spirochaetota bacterium]HSA15278.1 gamma carbonic anhydrase family protein [Spirochaetota bacterium]
MILSVGKRELIVECEDYFIAENATIVGSVIVKQGVSVWFGAVIRADNDVISIGRGTNIQDCCVLHADEGSPLEIGECVTVGHGAVLHGCTIGSNSLIGINSTVLNNSVIGENCIVGAGAVVPERTVVPAGSVVLGMPGKIARKTTPEEIAEIRKGARHYIEKIRQYKR